eukprot:scaffold259619_cov41-Tisochrysis_lutea.AAC.4
MAQPDIGYAVARRSVKTAEGTNQLHPPQNLQAPLLPSHGGRNSARGACGGTITLRAASRSAAS